MALGVSLGLAASSIITVLGSIAASSSVSAFFLSLGSAWGYALGALGWFLLARAYRIGPHGPRMVAILEAREAVLRAAEKIAERDGGAP